MKKLVVLTGAGVSQESGINTFRDSGGLWENHNVADVATPEAWRNNQDLVIRFYNERRKQLDEVEPNDAHKLIAKLEEWFDVTVITQNVDDLHERGGSSNVVHLHGELRKVRSEKYEDDIKVLDGWELKKGDLCAQGYQLRPHIVWFGEAVPAMDEAVPIVEDADIMVVVGTSLAVYPAAGLVQYVKADVPVYVVDPHKPEVFIKNVHYIEKKAVEGMKILVEELKELS